MSRPIENSPHRHVERRLKGTMDRAKRLAVRTKEAVATGITKVLSTGTDKQTTTQGQKETATTPETGRKVRPKHKRKTIKHAGSQKKRQRQRAPAKVNTPRKTAGSRVPSSQTLGVQQHEVFNLDSDSQYDSSLEDALSQHRRRHPNSVSKRGSVSTLSSALTDDERESDDDFANPSTQVRDYYVVDADYMEGMGLNTTQVEVNEERELAAARYISTPFPEAIPVTRNEFADYLMQKHMEMGLNREHALRLRARAGITSTQEVDTWHLESCATVIAHKYRGLRATWRRFRETPTRKQNNSSSSNNWGQK
jgi:hypothetical protein